jgi:hypothetical protein
MIELPPLPADIEAWIEPMSSAELAEAMRAYGEACYRAGMEQANRYEQAITDLSGINRPPPDFD